MKFIQRKYETLISITKKNYSKFRVYLKVILVVLFTLVNYTFSQTKAQLFGRDDRSYIILFGKEAKQLEDQFYKWTRDFRDKHSAVTVYNFENYMRDGLQNVLNGRIPEGIGAIGIVATEEKDEAWWLLGCIYSYGLGVPRNAELGNHFFDKAGMSKLYNAAEIAQLERSFFLAKMEQCVADMSRSIEAKIMLLNDMNSTINAYNPSSTTENSGSLQNRKSSCKYCNGTGYFIQQSSTHGTLVGTTPYYNSAGSRCSICGAYNQHWHLECKH